MGNLTDSVTVNELDNKLEDMEEESVQAAKNEAPTPAPEGNEEPGSSEDQAMDASFMSESIYQKIPSPRSLKHRSIRMRLCYSSRELRLIDYRETIYAGSARAFRAGLRDKGNASA